MECMTCNSKKQKELITNGQETGIYHCQDCGAKWFDKKQEAKI